MKPFTSTLTPASATALLATLLLARLAAAAPAPVPGAPISPVSYYTDPNDVNNNGIADWKEPQGWAPPDHFDWSILTKSKPDYGKDYGKGDYGGKDEYGPGYRSKREAEAGHDDGYDGHDDGHDDHDDGHGGSSGSASQVCSGNDNVASCCSGGGCSVLPVPVLSGLLNLGGISALSNSGCQAQQQISCCPQNGGGLLNIQSCGPLVDIL